MQTINQHESYSFFYYLEMGRVGESSVALKDIASDFPFVLAKYIGKLACLKHDHCQTGRSHLFWAIALEIRACILGNL